jgi:phospholipid/cholesterol/gamma-HCH transport system substrate-binding protein
VITRSTKLKLAAFVAVALLGISYLSFRYVGLDRVLLGTGYDVAADFTDSGGIFVNAEVTYRGVAVGRVSDMKLVGKDVRVVMSIDPDADPIPKDTDAVVATRSAVGEQYVILRPTKAGGPYLKDGDVIPDDRTSIPIPVEKMLLHIDQLVGSLDEKSLRILVDELGKAFNGAGDDLGRLIDNGNLLLTRAEQSLPQTLKLITDGKTVLDTQRDSRSAIRQWAADLRLVTDTLVTMDPDIRSILVNAPNAGQEIQNLVDRAGPGLGSLVRNLDILNRVTIPNIDGIQQLFVTYPDVVTGGFTVVRRDEDGQLRSHFGFVLNANDPRSCISGYVPTSSTPSPGAVRSVNTDAVRCEVINGVDPNPGDGYDENGSNIRGAQNIGRSGGRGPTPPPGQVTGQFPANPLATILGGLLSANPFSTTLGPPPVTGLPTLPTP